MHQRPLAVEQLSQLVVAAAEQGQHAGRIAARATAGGQNDLNARAEALCIARISLDDVIKGGVDKSGVAAIGVRAVIQKPPQWFGLEILARCEEGGEAAPAQPVDVGAVVDQQFHDRDAARLGQRLKRDVIDQHLAELGVTGQQRIDARHVMPVDGLAEFARLFE